MTDTAQLHLLALVIAPRVFNERTCVLYKYILKVSKILIVVNYSFGVVTTFAYMDPQRDESGIAT